MMAFDFVQDLKNRAHHNLEEMIRSLISDFEALAQQERFSEERAQASEILSLLTSPEFVMHEDFGRYSILQQLYAGMHQQANGCSCGAEVRHQLFREMAEILLDKLFRFRCEMMTWERRN